MEKLVLQHLITLKNIRRDRESIRRDRGNFLLIQNQKEVDQEAKNWAKNKKKNPLVRRKRRN